MVHLCTGDLAMDDFVALVEGYPWSEDALLMAFTPVEARFARFRFDAGFLAQTEQGRIFSASRELRWRLLDQRIRVVYLGEAPVPAGLSDCSSELNGLKPSRRKLLLWGERTDTENEWIEQQVPHRFSYPVDSAEFARGRAAVVVEEWADSVGIPKFDRYHSIIEVKGG